MTNAISVKDRLKKQAIEDGKTMQDKRVTYGLERTIYRLSVSNYVERFTLEGGIFLYIYINEVIKNYIDFYKFLGERFFSLHNIICCKIGIKLFPNFVNEYSTLGGTS